MCVRRIAAMALGLVTTIPVMALVYPDALRDDDEACEPVVAALGLVVTAAVLAASTARAVVSCIAASCGRPGDVNRTR